MGDKEEKFYDVVILGGGPAGLSAGIYAARGNLKTAVIDKCMFGGKPSEYLSIENYPGFAEISACELAERFEAHADKFGVDKYPMSEIKKVDLISETKIIETEDIVFKSRAVIIATGSKPKQLNIPGEKKFKCKGVSYCAVCDGAFFKDKVLAVIGGGNSALEEAVYLTKYAKKVYIIHRRDNFKADKLVCERAKQNEKIEFIYNSVPLEINGENTVNSIKIKNIKTEETFNLNVDGVFPYIGDIPNTEAFSGQVKLNAQGYVETDIYMQTSQEGVFAAGDVRNTPFKQVVTAVSDGASAACSAVKYNEKFDLVKS